jgi:hypothetical protein
LKQTKQTYTQHEKTLEARKKNKMKGENLINLKRKAWSPPHHDLHKHCGGRRGMGGLA